MELYIIRHGQSANNALRDESGRTFDPQLTEVGKQQAEHLAAFLAGSNQREPLYTPLTSRPTGEERPGFGITHLYTSAMHRAMQTAAPVAQALNLKPEIWLDIHEQGGLFLEEAGKHVGYPGKTRAEILDEFPNYVLPDTITDRGWYDITHGYEGMYSGAGRAIKVAVELRRLAAAEFKDARVALITHGTFIDLMIKAFLNQLPEQRYFYASLNTAITRLDFNGDVILLRYVNRVDHLPVDLIT